MLVLRAWHEAPVDKHSESASLHHSHRIRAHCGRTSVNTSVNVPPLSIANLNRFDSILAIALPTTDGLPAGSPPPKTERNAAREPTVVLAREKRAQQRVPLLFASRTKACPATRDLKWTGRMENLRGLPMQVSSQHCGDKFTDREKVQCVIHVNSGLSKRTEVRTDQGPRWSLPPSRSRTSN